jgi:hypothetical protein
MTTVADVDRLVVAADQSVAHYWPRLGPRVRTAYLADRNKWIALRNAPDKGASTPAATLETHRRVFTGWLRAFKTVAARPRRHPTTASAAAAVAAPVAPPAASTKPATVAPVAPIALAAAGRGTSGVGAAVAGGLVLAGLIAVAANRRRA